MLMRVVARDGVGTPQERLQKELNLVGKERSKKGGGGGGNCRTSRSNLPELRGRPTLHQLNYNPAKLVFV